MNILFIDSYPAVKFRISKDQNGGFGTANDYGDDIFSRFVSSIVKKSINFPPLYAVQSIGELVNNGHNVEFSNNFIINRHFDLYVVTSSIVCHETEIEVIKRLKHQNKNIFAIGPFATVMPKPYIDAGATVIVGEPEMFFHTYKEKEFDKLEKIIENFPVVDLDQLAIPGWKVIFKNYTPRMSFLGSGPAVNINASRGCPYSCFFYCVYPLQQGRKLRLKSSDKLIYEMEYLNKELKVNNFLFRDPVFSIDRKHTLEICEKIINKNLKFNIGIETHLKNIDFDLANKLKKAGVKLMYVGIESGDIDVRKNSHRASENNDEQIKKVAYLEKIGIQVKAMYIIGMPSDTKEKFMSTLEYAKKLNSSYAQFSVFTPYPGTPAFKEYEGLITTTKFENFNQWQLVFKHPNFTENDVRNLLTRSYRTYYLNFNWIFRFGIAILLNFYESISSWLFRLFRIKSSKLS
jgi:anaerobic magnesium-protoporphyrin IX monomethyl ester cyclase